MASKNSSKDQAMAAVLKQNGVQPTTRRCPVCNRMIACKPHKGGTGDKGLYNHLAAGCKAGK